MTANGGKSLTHWAAAAALPLVFLALGLSTLLRLPPIWWLYPDPSYQYLLNGLGVTVGGGTGHTDHPGTSLQWLVGLVNVAYHGLTTSGVSLIEDVTLRPEEYLRASAVVLIVLQALALLALGIRIRNVFGLGAALLAQAAVLGTTALYPYRLYVIPESLVIICGIALLALVAPKLATPGGTTRWPVWLGVGAMLAVGVTAKVIFLPMLVIPLFLYNWRTLLRMAAVFTVSFVAIMWVTRDQIQRMWDWYTAVAKTSARYPDEVVTRSLTDGLRDIPGATIHNYPVVLIALAILVVGVVLRWRQPVGRPRAATIARVLLPLGLAILGTLAMTYKAYRVNDLFLLAPLAGAVAAIGWGYIDQTTSTPRGRRLLLIVPIVTGAAASLIAVTTASDLTTRVSDGTNGTRMIAYLNDRVANGATAATGYGAFSQASALYWANEWARYVSVDETLNAYPGWIEFNIWNHLFYTFNTDEGVHMATCQELSDIVAQPGGLLLAPGRPLELDTTGSQYAKLTFQPERVFGDQIVYRVQSVTCP